MKLFKSVNFLIMAVFLLSCSQMESPEVIPCVCENPDNTLGFAPCMCEPAPKKVEKRKVVKQQPQKVVVQDNRKVVTYENQQVVERANYVNRRQLARQEQVYEPEQIVIRRKVSRRVPPAVIDGQPQVLNRRYTERTYYIDDVDNDVYEQIHHLRDDYASIKLEYVDFRLKNGGQYNVDQKLGNYRFRIFGCRRESKNVFLNQGRAMEKDMRFFDIFFDRMNKDYPVVVPKNSPMFADSDKIKTPEYIITAEITDYFMNICDEYDWDKNKGKKLRTGSSEITITWRIMDLCKTHVYWKGETVGYGEVNSGEPNGETLLVERAFADAMTQLNAQKGFEKQMLKRVSPRDLMNQQRCVDQLSKKADNFQCKYKRDLADLYGDDINYDSPCIEEREYYVNCADENSPQCIEQRGGSRSYYGQVPSEDLYAKIVDEDGNLVAKGSAIDMSGGSRSSGLVATAKVKDPERWVDIPLKNATQETIEIRKTAEMEYFGGKNKLCINSVEPYSSMKAPNLYKVRASIVSVEGAGGKKGAGLIVSDQFILTSADMLDPKDNSFNIKTINNKNMKANAFRVNPNKNVALLLLNEKTEFNPLPLTLDLPEVNKDVFLVLGMVDLEGDSEGYLDNNGKVTGYRYTDDRGAEIIVNTDIQSVTIGGALIDKHGNIVGLSHAGKQNKKDPDLFIPVETALKSLDLSICDKAFTNKKPWKEPAKVTAKAIDSNKTNKAPKTMDKKEVK